MSTHAKFSPSSAHRWMRCPASAALEALYPDTSSEFADEGTAAHEVAAGVLTTGKDPTSYENTAIDVNGSPVKVDSEMVENVLVYTDYISQLGGHLAVEERLDISAITGEANAGGTSDAVVIQPDVLTICDLKYGRGVKVFAKENEQLMIYALAAVDLYSLTETFKQVRLIIVQPRLDHIDEWECDITALHLFGKQVEKATSRCRSAIQYFAEHNAMHDKYFEPGEKQCQFCKAKANCPALAKYTLTIVSDDFVDLSAPIAPQIEEAASRIIDNPTLGNMLNAVPIVENWCKAIRAKAESELFAGHDVPGYKLVEGRKGARSWVDDEQAEAMLKQMRLKTEQMYNLKLITPTTAEKLFKDGAIGPRQWPKLKEQITQTEGKPSVAPESDKRPALAITAVEDDFSDLTGAAST